MTVVRMVRPAVPVRTVRTQVRGLEKAGHQGLGRVQRHGANFLVVVLRRRGLLRKPTGMVEEGRLGGHRTSGGAGKKRENDHQNNCLVSSLINGVPELVWIPEIKVFE